MYLTAELGMMQGKVPDGPHFSLAPAQAQHQTQQDMCGGTLSSMLCSASFLTCMILS